MVACNDPQKKGKKSFRSAGCKKTNPRVKYWVAKFLIPIVTLTDKLLLLRHLPYSISSADAGYPFEGRAKLKYFIAKS